MSSRLKYDARRLLYQTTVECSTVHASQTLLAGLDRGNALYMSRGGAHAAFVMGSRWALSSKCEPKIQNVPARLNVHL
jgi:hypothetical protein